MALGLGLAVVLGRRLAGAWRTTPLLLRLAWVLCAAGALTGVAIMIVGAAGPFRRLLPIHIALSLAGGVPLLVYAAGTRLRAAGGRQRVVFAGICALLVVAAVGSATAAARSGAALRAQYRIVNPASPPLSMEGEGAGPQEPVLPLVGRHQRARHHPGHLFHDERELRAVPQGALRAVALVDAPLLVVQQPVVPEVHRIHAGRGRDQAVQVVRRLPRSRGVLQRPLRSADQGADRDPGSAGRARLHVLPFDHARPQHHGPGGFRDRVPAAARSGGEREPRGAVRPRSAHLHRPRAAPADLPEAVPSRADARVLLVVPQGPPRPAGEQLPLVPRLQRLRQLAGVRRVGRRARGPSITRPSRRSAPTATCSACPRTIPRPRTA